MAKFQLQSFRVNSIRLKLVGMISGISLIMAILVYVFLPRQLEQRGFEGLRDKADTLADISSAGVIEAMLKGDRESTEELFRFIREDSELIYLVVESKDARIFASINQDRAIHETYNDVPPDEFFRLDKGVQLLKLSRPLIHEGWEIGRIYMGFSLEDLQSEIILHKWAIAVVSGIIFFIFHLAGTWISSYLTRPLSEVLRTAERIAAGDLESRAQVKGKDETGDLALAFNIMVDKLNEARGDLEDANRYLEDRIKDRTRDLEREIHKHRQTLDALREERDNKQRYLDVVEVMLVAFDLDAKVILINQKGCKVLGYPEDEIVGKVWFDHFLPIEVRIVAKERIQRITLGNQQIPEYSEDFVLRSDGSRRLIAWHNKYLTDGNGNINGILRSGTDITKVRVLEKQLRHSQKMEAIGTLAGGIAHDFNNILTGIIWCAQLSREEIEDDSTVEPYQKEIIKAANRAKDLVQQILAFSRQQESERGPVEIHIILKETLRLLNASLPKTIQVHEHISDKAGFILADPTQLHQIIMNLCTNAYQAMGEKGGVLTVSLERFDNPNGASIRLIISDTGHGMDPNTIERIFDPFFTTKSVDQGTGLGLSVVHGILTDYGATVEVDSKPGRGSSFKVEFQAYDGEPLPEDHSDRSIKEGSESVLLVDDEEAIVRLGATYLGKLGFKVTTFTSAIDALEMFEAMPHLFHVIVSDQVMPDMLGTEFGRRVREISKDIPIIFITGHSEIINPETTRIYAPAVCLQKPFEPRELAANIRAILDKDPASTISSSTII